MSEIFKTAGKHVGSATAGGVGAAGVLLIVVNSLLGDVKAELKESREDRKELAARVALQDIEVARLQERLAKAVEYLEWQNGRTAKLEEVKKQ